ncbi:MAG: PadR family transcriptional regulator [Streptosporangiaceae bacterium]
MSAIFRHGRLRLYLLKLLDEAPRHGYEVIRLLQDRFMGVYSPSPGTIYPRLARLEDDGLVTHDEADGRKVYRITEKGRAEIRARLDDLAQLEEELTESVRDIAREVSEDVRETVRGLREEITWTARDIRRDGRGARERRDEPDDRDQPDAMTDAADGDAADGLSDDAWRIRDEARRARQEIRDAFRSRQGRGCAGGSRPGGRRPAGARQDWAGWAGKAAGWPDWGGMPAGLEGLASDFARDLSHVAGHAGDLGESALGDLKDILADALTRIRDEVFAPARDTEQAAAGPSGTPADPGPAEDPAADGARAGNHAADRQPDCPTP